MRSAVGQATDVAERLERARRWLPRGLALVVFAAYAWLVPAGPFWLDSSELTAGSFALGSPHPTGFPLYCLVGKALSLIPLGEIAFRYHLLSALSGALAVLAVARLIAGASRPDAAGLVGALAGGALLAVALGFVRNATVAEVYAPTAAVLAAALVLFDRVARGGSARDGLMLALVAGLGIGLHGSFRVLLGVPIAVLVVVRLYRGARWPLYAPLIALGVGVALHLYLPVRSASSAAPRADWGQPRTAGALLDHVSAREIRDGLAGQLMSSQPDVIAADAGRFGRQIADGFGPLGLVAALGGLAWLALERRGRALGAVLAAVALADAGFSIWINPLGIDDLQDGVPLLIALAALAGLGVAALARTAGRGAPFVGAALAVIVTVGPALGALPQVAASRDDLPRAVAEAALAQAPPRGAVLVRSDSLAAILMLAQQVEGARPDALVLIRQRLADAAQTDAAVAAAGLPGRIDLSRPLAWLDGHGRTIAWELSDDGTPPGRAFALGAPLVRLLAPGEAPPADDAATARAALDRLFSGPGARYYLALRFHAHGLTTLGRIAVLRGQLAAAGALFETALAIRPEHAEAWVNLGVVASRTGDLAAAAEATDRALALDPNRVGALVNAARYRLALGEPALAEAHALRAIRLKPGTATAWLLAGLAAARRGETAVARTRLERALAIDPSQRDAAAALAQLPGR